MKTIHKGWAVVNVEKGIICGGGGTELPVYISKKIADIENTYPQHGYSHKVYKVMRVSVIIHTRKNEQ